jgi:hypothetical protein
MLYGSLDGVFFTPCLRPSSASAQAEASNVMIPQNSTDLLFIIMFLIVIGSLLPQKKYSKSRNGLDKSKRKGKLHI